MVFKGDEFFMPDDTHIFWDDLPFSFPIFSLLYIRLIFEDYKLLLIIFALFSKLR